MTQYTKKRRKSSLGRIDIEGTHTHTHSLNWETMGGETERNSVRKSGRNGKIVWKKRERKAARESSPKGEKRGLCAARKVRKF